MNLDLMRKVRDHIVANPAEFDMREWCKCLAGIAHIVEFGSIPIDVMTRPGAICGDAAILLGLTTQQALQVFRHSCWPREFSAPYAEFIDNEEARALIAARYIDDLIEENSPPAEESQEELEYVYVRR